MNNSDRCNVWNRQHCSVFKWPVLAFHLQKTVKEFLKALEVNILKHKVLVVCLSHIIIVPDMYFQMCLIKPFAGVEMKTLGKYCTVLIGNPRLSKLF